MTTAQTQTAWPEGVIARYLTVTGATVDIDSQSTSRCTACHETDADDRFVSRGNSESRARRWAQRHAEKCRALPRPTA
jgi:hypothetical protein